MVGPQSKRFSPVRFAVVIVGTVMLSGLVLGSVLAYQSYLLSVSVHEPVDKTSTARFALAAGGDQRSSQAIVDSAAVSSPARSNPARQTPPQPVSPPVAVDVSQLFRPVALLDSAVQRETTESAESEEEARSLSYRWNEGERFRYQFDYQLGEDGRDHRAAGYCDLTVGAEVEVDEQPTGTGTGFVIAPGYIATCAHVVEHAAKVTGVFGKQSFSARVLDIDHENDVAILQIEGDPGLASLPLSDSDSLELAESVLVIGFPLTDVLGSGIKVSRGMVAGIDPKQGGKAITIDGAVNPGNSGGPVLNERGEVVGLASATLAGGQAVNPVGFASQVKNLHAMLSKNGIELTKNDQTAAPMQAKDITRRSIPSIGLLEIHTAADSVFRKVAANVRYTRGQQNPFDVLNRVLGKAGGNAVSISRLGDIHGGDSSEQLPYLFATVPQLLVQRFDPYDSQSWTVSSSYHLRVQEAPPLPGFGHFPLNPRLRHPMFGFGPSEPPPEPKTLEAVLKQDFEVISAEKNVVCIKTSRDFTTLGDAEKPLIAVSGGGEWQFDLAAGVPIRLNEELTVVRYEDDKRIEQPLALSFQRTAVGPAPKPKQSSQEVAVKQQLPDGSKTTRHYRYENGQLVEVDAPPEPKSGLEAGSLASIETLLSVLSGKSSSDEERLSALKELATIRPDDARREEVIDAAKGSIAGTNHQLHDAAWSIYRRWMDASNAPELRRVLAKSRLHRQNARMALFDLALEEDVPLMLEHVITLSGRQMRKLKQHGSQIETLVIDAFENTNDEKTQVKLLDIIQLVATPESAPRLSKLMAGQSVLVRTRMRAILLSLKLKQF